MAYSYLDGKKSVDRYRVSSQLAAIIANAQKDPAKKEEFLKALAFLSNEEQESLKVRLASVKSDLERWLIISDVVKNIQETKLYKDSQVETDVDAKKRRQMLIFSLGALLVGGAFIYIILKKI